MGADLLQAFGQQLQPTSGLRVEGCSLFSEELTLCTPGAALPQVASLLYPNSGT